MKIKALHLVVIAILLGGALVANASELRSNSGHLVQASVSFSRLVTDSEVESFLISNQALPFAIFTCANDLCGVHRIVQSKASLGLVVEARQKAIEMESNAQRGIRIRAQGLVRGLAEKDFVASEELVREGRGLLSVAQSVDLLQDRAMQGEPIIYGIQIVIRRSDLERIMNDPALVVRPATIEVTKVGLRRVTPTPEQPDFLLKDHKAEEQQPLSPAEVYVQLLRLNDAP